MLSAIRMLENLLFIGFTRFNVFDFSM
jgi:hypothetical protein